MSTPVYCGRRFTENDLQQIRAIIEADDRPSRAEISRRVCRQLQWQRSDGKLKE